MSARNHLLIPYMVLHLGSNELPAVQASSTKPELASASHCSQSLKEESEKYLPRFVLTDGSANLVKEGNWHVKDAADQRLIQNRDGSIHLARESNSKAEGNQAIWHDIELPSHTQSDAQAGLPLHLTFFARSQQSQSLTIEIMQSKYPFAQTMNERINLTPEWKQYDFDGVAPNNGDRLALHLKTKGPVDIKGISVTPESAEQLGLKPGELTDRGITDNIDRFRKGELKIDVVDRHGKPIPGADVHLEQKKQDFLFGTEVQGLNLDDHSSSQQAYERTLKETFNFATVTPYWPQTEKQSGNVKWNSFDKQISWLTGNDFSIKAHPAFWPHFTPAFVPNDPDQAVPIIDQHTKEFAEHLSRFPSVKFVENNEVAAAETDATENGATNWVRKVGPAQALERETAIEQRALHIEHQTINSPSRNSDQGDANHPVQIVYNDYLNNQQEIQMLDKLQKDGRLPDAIGIQMHMTQGNWPLEKVEHIIDQLSKYGKPIYISEISVLSGEHRIGGDQQGRAWKTTADGEQEQADYAEKLYKVLYSNPHIKGITWWDLSDKNSWQSAPRGLLREDMSPKPAYERLHNLIHNNWRTDIHAATDLNGNVQQRVFAGDYEVTVTDPQGKKIIRHAHVSEGQTQSISIDCP